MRKRYWFHLHKVQKRSITATYSLLATSCVKVFQVPLNRYAGGETNAKSVPRTSR
ncbi:MULTISPECIES: hypothetical protein [Phocaeicola]|uniref:hypothetical protein n=1 Tax=Phocaeicola TaxID=909656 RepID=UPI0015FC3A02|nr:MULTISPECIES: hypothetical protein [Phocaeicola]MBT9909439.1 hypothetical protein [Phocaeicola dorei]